jgi:adenylyltransferase/sulfurtransferase
VPPPGSTPTCDTVGVLAPAANIIASLEVVEGLKILVGREDQLLGQLLYVDVWNGTFERLAVGKGAARCSACDEKSFDFLKAEVGSYTTSLCGRNAVQVSVRGAKEVSFPALAARLENVGTVRFNQHMLRFQADSREVTVFPDGRAIIKGTSDEAVARSLYARYIGL